MQNPAERMCRCGWWSRRNCGASYRRSFAGAVGSFNDLLRSLNSFKLPGTPRQRPARGLVRVGIATRITPLAGFDFEPGCHARLSGLPVHCIRRVPCECWPLPHLFLDGEGGMGSLYALIGVCNTPVKRVMNHPDPSRRSLLRSILKSAVLVFPFHRSLLAAAAQPLIARVRRLT